MNKLGSASRAVATAERRLNEQREVVDDRRAQLRFAMACAGTEARNERLINAGATYDAARTELDIRERVLLKTQEHLAAMVRDSEPTPRLRPENKSKIDTPPPPQNKKEAPKMSNPRQEINDAIDTALYAQATESEIARARAMNPEAARRFLTLRANRRAKGTNHD